MAEKPTEHALERLVFFSDAVFAIARRALEVGDVDLDDELNRKVNATATRPPMLAEGVAAALAASVPRRSLSVVLGAVTSLVIAAFVPYAAPAGMITIPLWRRLLERKRAGPADADG